jgi:hypothetical protein
VLTVLHPPTAVDARSMEKAGLVYFNDQDNWQREASAIRVSTVYRTPGSAWKVKAFRLWVCSVFRTPGSACKG